MQKHLIYSFKKAGQLEASNDGFILTSPNGYTEQSLNAELSLLGKDLFARALQLVLPVFLEQDIALIENGSITIAANHVHRLYDQDFGLTAWLPAWCPFIISIEARGSVGDPSLRFEYSFFQGPAQAYCTLIGSIIKHGTRLYSLPKSLFDLIQLIENFNALKPAEKSKAAALLVLSKIKSLTNPSTKLDQYLNLENVVVPDKAAVGLDFDASGRLTMYPQIEGVPENDLKRTFLQLSEAQDVYDIQTPDGGRIRVVLPDTIKQAVKRMHQVSHIEGKQKDQIIAEPRSVFEGIDNQDCIDLSQFGPRVKGIGPYIFQPKPYVKRTSGGFLDLDNDSLFSTNLNGKPKYKIGIQAEDPDGNPVNISFESPEELTTINEKLEEASLSGQAVIRVMDDQDKERILPITDELKLGLESLAEQAKPPKERSNKKDSKNNGKEHLRYVLIYGNEELVDYNELVDEPNDSENSQLPFKRPVALISDIGGSKFELKQYQAEGIAWLQHCLTKAIATTKVSGRRGVLLADDMGLGKTLQVLSFLAWCIEDGLMSVLGSEVGPYKPILVIAPVILLDVWKQELEKFFIDDGAIFLPYVVLYDNCLREHKTEALGGKEYEFGRSVLNLDKLKQNRLIITNYDTVKNYQHSFAKIEWSVLVVDEAQEIKEPKTAITAALKSINALFKIALTGTPVENRLLDLWNITDFYQPGLLGSAKEFTKSFETDAALMSEQERARRSEELRGVLKYNSKAAYVLRRTKEEQLPGLPKKQEIILETKLSPEQVNLHHAIIQELKQKGKGQAGKHLGAVQRLSRLYQHIALETEARIEQRGEHYSHNSPKLAAVLDLLEDIRYRKEKVLVFALFTKMQFILQLAIEHKFRFKPDIVNGSVSSTGSGGSNMRRNIINRFQEKNGFNVLILSPDVAGVGLTITAANHVIHYGRWWNPAKEAQATDRVYRLGQTKDVYVYYPISCSENFTSFDVRLHELLRRKRELARDFLVPAGSLVISDQEILDSISVTENADGAVSETKSSKMRLGRLSDLDPTRFVAFCAYFFSLQGYHTVLTPLQQNGGIDLIAAKNGEVILVACSFDLTNEKLSFVQTDALKKAQDLYRKQICPSSFDSWRYKLAFFTNCLLDKQAIDIAKQNNIVAYDRKELEKFLERAKVGMVDLNKIADDRVSTIDQIKERISIAEQAV